MLTNKYIKIAFLLLKILAAFLIAIIMVIYPQIVFNSAIRGLETWWHIVFPALLPFFVVSEIFMGLGLVNFFGVLLEPIMRPLFNLPGTSAFVVAVGYTSGAPIGAVLTSKLRKENLCSKTEGSHLLAFTNNASPLFMFGAVAVGMFNNPALGPIIAGAHYLANLCVGFILRFYGRAGRRIQNINTSQNKLFERAAKSLYRASMADGRPMGQLLGDAIKNSVQTLLTVGGFIIIFSVIIEVLNLLKILKFFTKIFSAVLFSLKLEPSLLHAFSCGFVEMTIGTKLASETLASITQQIVVSSLILGWLGLSVHAQVISMVADTDLDIKPYIAGRFLHSLLAGFWTIIFLKLKLQIPTYNMPYNVLVEKPWLYSFYTLKTTSIMLLTMVFISHLLTKYNKHKKKILFFTSIYKKNKYF